MKKFYFVLGLIAMISMFSAVSLQGGSIINVPGPYGPTIQAAIDAAGTGDTIVVAPGIYNEKVIINKSGITLLGAKAGIDPRLGTRTEGDPLTESIIDGNFSLFEGFFVQGTSSAWVTNVVIDGFDVRNQYKSSTAGEGVRFDFASNVILRNTMVHGCQNEGIKTRESCSGLLIQKVISHNNVGDGIELGDYGIHQNHVIEDSDFYNNEDRGIFLVAVDQTVVRRIKTYGNKGTVGDWYQGGIIAYQCTSNTYTDIECFNNYGSGIHLYKENYSGTTSSVINGQNKVYNNHPYIPAGTPGDGIRLYLSHNITIQGTECYGNDRHGICVGSFGRYGDTAESSDHHSFTDNYLHNNTGAGIMFEGIKSSTNGSFCSATCNKITGNSGYGISNTTPNTVPAINNWWGSASGPGGEGSGTGDKVSTKVPYIPWLAGPKLEGTPSAGLNFGDVPAGTTSALQTITIKNTACLFTLHVSGVAISGTSASEFEITPSIPPFDLLPGDSKDVNIVFKPVSAGLKGASLDVSSDDPDHQPFSAFLLKGTGTAPDITATPTTYNYGSVAFGSSPSTTFTITNDGLAPLTLSSLGLAGANPTQFSITDPGVFPIPPGNSTTIKLNYTPTIVGSVSASLVISTNDPDESPFPIPLSGSGLGPDIDVSPLTHDFGNVDLGATGTKTFTITNAGNADLTVSGTSIAGVFFSIASGGAPFTLGPGLTSSLVVNFSPTTEDPKTATLSLTSNDPDEGTVTVSLSGTGKSIAMKTFEIEEAKLDWKKKPDDDKIRIKGTYNLPAGASPGPNVTLFVQNLPPFGPVTMDVKENNKKWEYKRPKNGTGFIKEMTIEWKAKEAKFDIHLDDADLGAIESWTNPVTFALQIGYFKDSETVIMKTHKDKWEYHDKK